MDNAGKKVKEILDMQNMLIENLQILVEEMEINAYTNDEDATATMQRLYDQIKDLKASNTKN